MLDSSLGVQSWVPNSLCALSLEVHFDQEDCESLACLPKAVMCLSVLWLPHLYLLNESPPLSPAISAGPKGNYQPLSS